MLDVSLRLISMCYVQTYPIFVDIGLTVDVDPNALQSKDSLSMSNTELDH